MKTKNKIFSKNLPLIGMILLLVSCGGQRLITAEERRELEELTQKVESREFRIIHQWADPRSGTSISLHTNPNFILLEGEKVEVSLPYFGVRYSGGGPGSEGGIKYEGPVENYKVEQRVKQQDVVISFEGRNENSEHLMFLITLFPNGSVTTSVTSSQRSTITYRGELED